VSEGKSIETKSLTESLKKKKEPTKVEIFQGIIDSKRIDIANVLPDGMSVDKFIMQSRIAYGANPDLQKCSPYTFLSACMLSAQMGLEPNTNLGQSYIIPFGNKAQFQIGYQGLLELCYRTGDYESISAYEVYKDDVFEYEYGLDQKLVHKPCEDPIGEPIYFYSIYRLKSGGKGFFVMSKKNIERHEKGNRKGKSMSTVWCKHYNEMAKKTCIKKMLKYAQKSTDLSRALTADESVKDGLSDSMIDEPNQLFEEE